jgi:DNA-binding transcriptional MocR family regulator
MTQREMMRRLLQRYGRNREQVIQAYANAERRGEVRRKNNTHGLSPETYAAALFADGLRKGWFR